MKTKNSLLIVALLLTTACSTARYGRARNDEGIDAVRVSAGIQQTNAQTEMRTWLGQTYTDYEAGEAPVGKLELVKRLSPSTEVGAIGGYSSGEAGTVAFTSYDVGLSMRQFVGDGTLRPYGELAVGYRRFDSEDRFFAPGANDLLFGTLSLGLDLRLSDRASIFVQGGYDAALGSDLQTDGAVAMFGFSVSF